MSELELNRLTRKELIEIILQQQAVIVRLERRIAQLEQRLKPGGGRRGLPGNKPASSQPRPERKEPRKPRPHGFARQRMAPTRRVEHALEACPECGTGLAGGWVQRTREVIEIPVVPVEVIEHAFVTRICPLCEKRQTPKAELSDVTLGRQRLGVNLTSLIAALREEGRMPFGTIQWYLKSVHQVHLSVGAIVQVLHRVAGQARQAMAQVLEGIRSSSVVQADETGWRQDGVNGYVWTFSTQNECYFLRRGRGKGVVDEVLDDSFAGVLVSDFYAAYDHYPGPKQRCWAHLLRDIHDLTALYPEDAKLARWVAAVHDLYAKALALSPLGAKQGRLAQLKLEKQLLARCKPFLNDPSAVQGKLCRRIERSIKELFVFVADAAVPPDNNAAERSLRHLVVSRKISGGTRSQQGTDTKMTLASLFATWRLRGLNPLVASRQLLASP